LKYKGGVKMAKKAKVKVFTPEKYSGIVSSKSAPLSGGQIAGKDEPLYENFIKPSRGKKGK
jgi:hypothetical protein